MHDWNVISADASLMQRLTRYMHRLVKEKEADPTRMTEEEFFAMVDKAEKDPSASMLPGEDLTSFLRRQGYDL